MSALPTRAKLFLLVELSAALFVLAFALAHWTWSSPGTFLLLLGVSIATGAMKVVLPGVDGNLSVSYVFLLWGTVAMGFGETLLVGWAVTLFQSYWHCKRKPQLIQLFFNLSVIALSIAAARCAFHAQLMQELVANEFLRVLLAGLAYFVVNTVSVSTIIGLTERLPITSVWRKSYLWSFPYYALGSSIVCLGRYFRERIGLEVTLLILPAVYLVYRTFVMHITGLNQALERAESDAKHAEETAKLHLRTIRALAVAIEAKDRTTGEHIHRVHTYSMELGKDFGLRPDEMEALGAAAVLHDVGKLAVPEHIISKPGKLTPDEFAKMKIHTIVGAEIVESVNFPFDVTPLVRSHHEKWDGSGYPDGLKGEEIPLGARILTAVDCLDALISDRQYRKAMPLDRAISIIQSEAGKSFDPSVVEILLKRCHELHSLAQSTLHQDLVKLSTDATVLRGLAPDAGYAAGSHAGDPQYLLDLEELTREVAILNAINSQIPQFDSIESCLLAIEPRLHELIPFESLALYRRSGDKLECILANGELAPILLGLSIESGVGVTGWTVANRTPLMNGNAATEFGVVGTVPSGFTAVAGLSIPLESAFGPIGALTLYSRQRDAFQMGHLRALLALSSGLAYRANLDFSGFAWAMRSASLPAGAAPVGIQLEQLSRVIESHAAPANTCTSQSV